MNDGSDVLVFLEASEPNIRCLDPAEPGMARESLLRAPARPNYGPHRPPKPGQKSTAAPDSSLPVSERIQELPEGTMTARDGKVVIGNDGPVAEEIFRILMREGWLDQLGEGSRSF